MRLPLIALLTLLATGCGDSGTNPGGDVSVDTGDGSGDPIGLVDDCNGLPVKPDNLRVDLYTPVFSNPTGVTNPLFPIAQLDRVLFLGLADGEPFRVETTLLPATKTINVNGQEVEALVSQYVAWVDRKIHEVAIDWYAQDDNGAVWYLGEDVFNYEDGVVADTDGTWLAGREGPAAMIMPANPMVGNVWRPENACPIVFEEVTADAAGVTVEGPQGPINSALLVTELHMDGTLEAKTFAPGYGEFSSGAGENFEPVALAVPTNALNGPVPEDVETLSDGSEEVFALAKSGKWSAVGDVFEQMNDAWDEHQSNGVAPLLNAQMSDALESLDEAIKARDKAATRQASVDVSLASLDLELQYVSRQEIDLDLIEVWTRQLMVDTEAGYRAAARSDRATLRIIKDRLRPASGGMIQ